MDKVATWKGGTQSHGFYVDVFHESKAGRYLAKLRTYHPSFPQRYIPGTEVPRLELDEEETLEHAEIDTLRDLVRQRIADRCGPITDFSE